MRALLLVLVLLCSSVKGVDIEELRAAGCPALFVTAAQTIAQYSALSVPDDVWDLATRKAGLTADDQRQLLTGVAQHYEDKEAWEAAMPILKEHWREIERLASLRAEAVYGDTGIEYESLLDLEIAELSELADTWDARTVRDGVAANSPADLVEDILNVRVEQNLDRLHVGARPKENTHIAALTREVQADSVAIVFQQRVGLQKKTAEHLGSQPLLCTAPTLVIADMAPENRLVSGDLRQRADLVRYNERSEGLFPEIRLNTGTLHIFGGGSLLTFNAGMKEFIRVPLNQRQEVDVYYHLDHMYGLTGGSLSRAGESVSIGFWFSEQTPTRRESAIRNFVDTVITGHVDDGYRKVGPLQHTVSQGVHRYTQAYNVTYIPEQGVKTVRFHLEFSENP
ncbi:MAG: hypothetical protein KDD51_02245 [Bdellovibrionales bacterium]|nr:hypothetical protein [Bdellovibrionales bacterium]